MLNLQLRRGQLYLDLQPCLLFLVILGDLTNTVVDMPQIGSKPRVKVYGGGEEDRT